MLSAGTMLKPPSTSSTARLCAASSKARARGFKRSVVTDSNGSFTLANLPIGPYRGGRSVYLKDPTGANIQLMQLAGRPGRAAALALEMSTGRDVSYAAAFALALIVMTLISWFIIRGIKRRKLEIYPTLNGKIMRRMYAILPNYTIRSSKILFTKSFKDALFNRLDIPENNDRDLS